MQHPMAVAMPRILMMMKSLFFIMLRIVITRKFRIMANRLVSCERRVRPRTRCFELFVFVLDQEKAGKKEISSCEEDRPVRTFALTGFLSDLSIQTLNMEMLFDVFCNDFTVEQINNTVSIVSIIRRVRHHYDGSSFFIQLGKEFHYFLTIR